VHEFESLVGLLLAAVLLAALARRVSAPYPTFLALGGAVLAFIPGAPSIVLEPELALALFVAPILLDAAYDASVRDLKDNWAPLSGLVIVAVGVTTIAVALVARALVPEMPWPAAIALGAIVAPPDAAAATAVLRQVRLPHRLLTILEGESLLNDATALLIYRVSVGAMLAGAFSFSQVLPTFILGVIGSMIVGPALGWLYLRATRQIRDIPSAILLQFIGTFGVWILAEHIGLSGVLTVVCYAVAVARDAPSITPARLRIPSYAVWETVVFLMNVLAFVLIGLQIRPILEPLEPDERTRYYYVAGAVLVTVMLVRIAWVMTYNVFSKLKARLVGFNPPRPMLPPTTRGALLVSWCGMRGVVTLAAALALPTGNAHDRAPGGVLAAAVDGVPAAFPYRDLIVLTAFSVVIGTLVIQGLTLKPLLKILRLRDDDPVGREADEARERSVRAALTTLQGDDSPAAHAVRHEYKDLLARATHRAGVPTLATTAHAALRRKAVVAARATIVEMRESREIGDDAFHRLEEELDWLEMSAGPQ
jgi:CPA1 family monovalent cation:H+ antiporter